MAPFKLYRGELVGALVPARAPAAGQGEQGALKASMHQAASDAAGERGNRNEGYVPSPSRRWHEHRSYAPDC